jgi:hypothetical protein
MFSKFRNSGKSNIYLPGEVSIAPAPAIKIILFISVYLQEAITVYAADVIAVLGYPGFPLPETETITALHPPIHFLTSEKMEMSP